MPLTQQDIDFLIKRNEKLKEIRALYEPLWNEIAQYILPGRIFQPESEGTKRTSQVYDSTAIFANDQLAASMCGTITPSSMVWAYLKFSDDRLNRIKECMDWLEYCSYMIHIARKNSNFYAEIPEVYADLGAFGQGCLLIEENQIERHGFNGFYYKALSPYEYCIAEDAHGFVDTVFREFSVSVRAAVRRWGELVGSHILELAESEPERKIKILHCVYPEEGHKLPFVSYYIDLENRRLISEGGYYELPYVVPRWRKSSGEDYGRGQGHIALPDIRTLNKAKELGLKSWAKDLDPPTFEKDGGIIGKLKLYPGGRNIARDKDSIWTLDRKARYDVSKIKESELITSIRQIFYSDQLKLQEGPQMTATEVEIRYELMQRLLGPAVGRFEIELLKRLVEREFGIMMRAGALPPPPPIIQELGIREVEVEYEGPLTRMQRGREAVAIDRLFQFLLGISGLMVGSVQQPIDNIDLDEAVRMKAETLGVPSKIMRSIEETREVREQRMRLIMSERQKTDLERLAKGAGKMAPMVKAIEELSKAEEANA